MADKVTLGRFRELDQQGLSATQIALILGVTSRTIIRWRAKYGFAHGEQATMRPETDRVKAGRLIEDGCSLSETARTLRISRATVRRWFPDAEGWTRREGGVYRQMLRLEWQQFGRAA